MRSLLIDSISSLALAVTVLTAGCHGSTRDGASADADAAPGPADAARPVDPGLLRSDLDRDLTPDASDADVAAVVAGNTAFAADLYRQLRTGDGNLFFSPHSISTALAMTYAGARASTAEQMAATLHFTVAGDTLHAAFNRLDLALASRASTGTSETRPFRLYPVNAIWGALGRSFSPAFLDTLAVHYGAGLRPLDFAADPEVARITINDWVAAATEDRIRDLLGPSDVDSSTPLVLTNAIYFSAAWQFPFDADDTAPSRFTTATGAVQVPTMRQTARFGYGAGAGYRAVELPYDGGQLSMVVILPEPAAGDGGDALAALETAVTGDRLGAILASIAPSRVALSLPTFSFSSPFDLAQTLVALGMVDAFGDADFSGIDSSGLRIAKVIHKAFVAIDEAGTEAAAATAVITEPPSEPPPPIPVAVDRPFLFLVRDIPTGAVLFLGRVVDPR